MIIELLKCKIHRATVTEANLNYIGSLTLDEDLINAASLNEFEKIQVLNITNGNRLETYVIKGNKGSGQVCINGAAAHLIKKGDLVIIVSYCKINEVEAYKHNPKILIDDQLDKTQAFHITSTSTAGGLCLFFSLLIVYFYFLINPIWFLCKVECSLWMGHHR